MAAKSALTPHIQAEQNRLRQYFIQISKQYLKVTLLEKDLQQFGLIDSKLNHQEFAGLDEKMGAVLALNDRIALISFKKVLLKLNETLEAAEQYYLRKKIKMEVGVRSPRLKKEEADQFQGRSAKSITSAVSIPRPKQSWKSIIHEERENSYSYEDESGSRSERFNASGNERKKDINELYQPDTNGSSKEVFKPIKIETPIYRPKPDSCANKVDRMEKFIASLKKDMRVNSVYNSIHLFRDNLRDQCEYTNLLQQLERYQMRSEDLTNLLGSEAEKRTREYFDGCEEVERGTGYRVVKIRKDMIRCKLGDSSKRNIDLDEINQQVNADFEEITSAIESKRTNFNDMMKQLTDTVEKTNDALKDLRQRRKKVYEQNVWDQLM